MTFRLYHFGVEIKMGKFPEIFQNGVVTYVFPPYHYPEALR